MLGLPIPTHSPQALPYGEPPLYLPRTDWNHPHPNHPVAIMHKQTSIWQAQWKTLSR